MKKKTLHMQLHLEQCDRNCHLQPAEHGVGITELNDQCTAAKTAETTASIGTGHHLRDNSGEISIRFFARKERRERDKANYSKARMRC